MRIIYQWLEFPVGNRAFGGGGWSRGAKHRPVPVVKEGCADLVRSGKSWIVGGVRRLKLNAWDAETGQLLRHDYPSLPEPLAVGDALKLACALVSGATITR